MTLAPPLLVIAGSTATGKTGLAIRTALALRASGIPAEIISADSRQVYRGLDIATAKATVAERAGVPHHGLDLVEPDAAFSLADFVDHVDAALPAITDAGGLAILVGGTGLYLRAIARGIDTAALPSDAVLRARLEAELQAEGLAPLVARLRALAPLRADQVDLRNPRRVVRALEIALIDGGRGALPLPRGYGGPLSWLGLHLDAATQASWIGRRARAQFDAGLIDEARALRGRFDPGLPAFSAIGYREAWAVLAGTMTREAAITEDARRNLAFAKRQRSWFRGEPDVVWHRATDPALDAMTVAAARRLVEIGAARR
ncbi:MAG: tRNA (adenosine(37)-N6)-dimethylallyltransferase MiaA [Chloroflexota bacterium]